jgi:nanoRNase/pAp phosphatase (c-di-AMP/oligoRNAs hydrolase)
MNSADIGPQGLGELLLKEIPLLKRPLNILIFTHRQADPDALCSSAAVATELIKSLETKKKEIPHIRIIAPQGASALGANLSRKLGIEYLEIVDPSEIESSDLIVSVDTGSPDLLGSYSGPIMSTHAKKVLIDHHSANLSQSEDKWKGFQKIVDGNATSTCEIITLRIGRASLPKREAEILLAGLLFDSQHLGIATESTLQAALLLVRAGAQIDQSKDLLRTRPDRSEVIARIKSAQRSQYLEVGKFILMKTEVSSFQASVARMLIDTGADVGLAYGEHEGEARVSIRSTQQFFRETNIDLGMLVAEIARKRENLTGGGHSTAASLSGKAMAVELSQQIVSNIAAALPSNG